MPLSTPAMLSLSPKSGPRARPAIERIPLESWNSGRPVVSARSMALVLMNLKEFLFLGSPAENLHQVFSLGHYPQCCFPDRDRESFLIIFVMAEPAHYFDPNRFKTRHAETARRRRPS